MRLQKKQQKLLTKYYTSENCWSVIIWCYHWRSNWFAQASSLKFENIFSKICVVNKVDSFSFRLANLLAELNILRLYNNRVFKAFDNRHQKLSAQNDCQNRGSLEIPMWKVWIRLWVVVRTRSTPKRMWRNS